MGFDVNEAIGFGAAVLTTIAFLPQVYKTYKTKDVSSLSLPMLILFFIGIILWLIYGILRNSYSMIFANTITVVSTLLLLYYKLKYGKQ
ncbi:SemiSWEET transporter [Aquimarina sp. U1-2]|uniref:SemiSWEET family sugar transporter n=1 Tax=Flavobacteriaceae TaxID=49546 RepID=UPI001939EC8D|nr:MULTISPECIES: SemiSWEET transporter [Flavobacteriaceae]MBP2834304.1 SemiSWEET transporter [Aquimarina sp. U1-2]